ncbi:MAG: hypothetical protein QG657_2610 [Acidobacteriota bacterium]|nr:hypothetical protein [Acidobacteriota bacterium]
MGTFLNYFRGKEYRLYVIIDEYDNFANTILSDSGKAEYRSITHGEGFLRSPSDQRQFFQTPADHGKRFLKFPMKPSNGYTTIISKKPMKRPAY